MKIILKNTKIIVLLLFFLSSITGNAQVTCSGGTTNIPRSGSVVINGVTVTSTYTGDVQNYTYGAWSSCSGSVTTSNNSLIVGTGDLWNPTAYSPWSVKLNFNKPVNDLVVVLTATGTGGFSSYNENFVFNSNGGTVKITAGTNCYSTISGNTIYSGAGAPLDTSGTSGGGGGLFKISAPTAYTSLTINGNGGLAGSLMAICGVSIKPSCTAGTLAPSVKNISYSCPTSYINLNTAHTGTTPSGASLVWFTNSTHIGTALSGTQVTQAGAGTYYAFYYDSTNGCYSPVSNSVIITNPTLTAPPVKNLSYSCPATYVDLNTAHTGTAPSGTSLVWFKNSTHAGTALSGTQVTQAGAGKYYAFYYSSTGNCYSSSSNIVTVTNTVIAAPPVQNLSYSCPNSSINLNTAHTGTAPSGTSVVWFTNNAHTGTALSGTQVTQAGAGTYYAFYYSSTGNCYSSASNAVIVANPTLTAPTVKNLSYSCPVTYADLNTAHTGTAPSGTSVVWFTNSAHTGTALSGTQVTQAGAGTYYAFYYSSISGCYSNASSPVIVTINSCEPTCPVENSKPSVQNLTNSCPLMTVDLSNAHTGTTPGASSIRWFTNNNHSGTPLSGTQITQAGTGTYYAFYYENGCYSLASNPVTVAINTCGPAGSPDLTIGIRANPATINMGGTSNITYTFSNIGTGGTDETTITYFIYKPQAGTLTIGNLNQTGWTITENATGYFITSNKIVQPGLVNALIMNTIYTHNGSNENAVYNVDAMVINGSGGETNFSNNRTTTLLKIN
ncbi:hypothetical protein [Epilithonimonas sp.]|uniref:hypothetical protein n=1 Tax=Epilithonimonas sp. TaxID=2894511 RepID=UPI0028978EE4|nr:hypothetical protein [Epilithonimonas sp.]